MEKSTIELIRLVNESIIAFSHFAWPILVLVVILIFRKPLNGLLARLRKAKGPGGELEFDREVEQLEKNTKEVQQKIPTKDLEKPEEDEPDVFADSIKDPKISIMILAREIEKEARELMASLGLLEGIRYVNVRKAFEMLEQKGFFAKNFMKSIGAFWDLRNRIVHGKRIEDKDSVIKVLDIGTTLLRMLKAIPREAHIVHHTGVDLFSDADCVSKLQGVKGLILETTAPSKKEKRHSIFPTTKTNYERSKKVAWEWDLSAVWEKTWYVNPDTGVKEQAWRSSGEFVGRHIEEL